MTFRNNHRVEGQPVREINQLRSAVNYVLERLFNGLLPGRQPPATAFSMALSCELAEIRAQTDARLWGKPKKHKRQEVETLLKCYDSDFTYETREWRQRGLTFNVDFCEVRKNQQLLCCESEVHEGHRVGIDFELFDDEVSYVRTNGYAWDLKKLVEYQAAQLLFVARVKKNNLKNLETTIGKLATQYSPKWSGSQLNIVIFPAGKTEKSLARLGVGLKGQQIQFQNLILSATER